jgi:hypothetical protein
MVRQSSVHSDLLTVELYRAARRRLVQEFDARKVAQLSEDGGWLGRHCQKGDIPNGGIEAAEAADGREVREVMTGQADEGLGTGPGPPQRNPGAAHWGV